MSDAKFQLDRLKMQETLLATAAMVDESVYTFVNDLQTRVSLWSDNAVRFFGFDDRVVRDVQNTFFTRIHPEDRALFQQKMSVTVAGQDTTHDLQYRVRDAAGNYVLISSHGTLVKSEDGSPAYYIGAMFNHGERAHLDFVTGLQNQNGFFERLSGLMEGKHPVCVLMVGINDFGGINDVFGYTYGNRVLREFSKILRWRADEYGVAYRLSGAKFALISHNRTAEELERFYNELRRFCKGGFEVDEHRQNLILNAGLLALDEFDLTEQTAFSCLNYAYRESKEQRQGDVAIFKNGLEDSSRRRLRMINEIRDCVFDDCRGFFLCYQPIVDCADGGLHGAEALVRWESEQFGLVPPNDFVPILETDVLFPDLGRWILHRALMDGRQLLKRYPDFIMNVNLSYSQLERSDFVEMVQTTLEETGFPAKNLCLEITERCRLLDIAMLQNIIIQLKSIGVRFALDDFGTGFSSLGALKLLHADVVKIDRAFVRNLTENNTDRRVIRDVDDIADTYRAQTCVEGVETQELWDILKEENIDTLQGYFFSKPVRFGEFVSWCEGRD